MQVSCIKGITKHHMVCYLDLQHGLKSHLIHLWLPATVKGTIIFLQSWAVETTRQAYFAWAQPTTFLFDSDDNDDDNNDDRLEFYDIS